MGQGNGEGRRPPLGARLAVEFLQDSQLAQACQGGLGGPSGPAPQRQERPQPPPRGRLPTENSAPPPRQPLPPTRAAKPSISHPGTDITRIPLVTPAQTRLQNTPRHTQTKEAPPGPVCPLSLPECLEPCRHPKAPTNTWSASPRAANSHKKFPTTSAEGFPSNPRPPNLPHPLWAHKDHSGCPRMPLAIPPSASPGGGGGAAGLVSPSRGLPSDV